MAQDKRTGRTYDRSSGPGALGDDLTREESATIKFLSSIQKTYLEHENKLYHFHEQFYKKYLNSLEKSFSRFNKQKTDFSEIMPYLEKLEEILKELRGLELNPTIEVKPELEVAQNETIIPDSEKSAKALFTIKEGKEYTQDIFKIHCLQTNKGECTLAVSNTSEITFPPHSFIRGAIYPINLVKLINSGDAIFVGYSNE
tara:strand:+ start:21799 stop:22398 length:600 start_codon:yes stop_codon:yes gene_type:complete